MKEALATLVQSLLDARKATASPAEPAPEAEALLELSQRATKLLRAHGQPQCLGFFGPSQAGKSFLVGALLSHELGHLEVICRDGKVDFLKEINPAKGVESTGVVTRFSTSAAASPIEHGDFRCRVTNLEVALQSLATGFLVECTAPATDPERVERVLREARLEGGAAAPPRFREAWDNVWHQLLKKYQDRHPYLNELRRHPELRSDGWKKGIGSVAGWLRVYSLFWGGFGYAPDLDRLAEMLVNGLETLGHPDDVEVELSHIRASADQPSLIDAACLNAIGQPQRPIEVFANGQPVAIDPSVMAALIAEIRLRFEATGGSLLDNTDLLDFPGGRALRGINGFEAKELSTGTLDAAIEVYKRGKLTFLFEQFSIEREITALVLASPGPTKPEAIQMQHQVERWLQIRYGARTPQDRDESESPSLFVGLTKYDMSLGALRSDNARDRWDSRVEEACVEFWARSPQSWVYRWSGERPFQNMFWIRNPYADQMNTLKPGTPDYEAVKAGYMSSTAVRTFIGRHGDKWAALEGDDPQSGLPRSGIPLLASHLRAKLAENIKERELFQEARSIHKELLDLLRALTPSRDQEERRRRLETNAESLVASLRAEMNRNVSGSAFGHFVELLTIPSAELEEEIREFWREVGPMSVKTSDKVKRLMVHVLKYWIARSSSRLRSSDLELPHSQVERFVREVCTSRKLLPVLGKAIFPYFARREVRFGLVATILQVKISDALFELFVERARPQLPSPVRLSFSESFEDVGEDGEVDWTDVDFGEERDSAEAAPETEALQLVFAGSRLFDRWALTLPAFYVESAGGAALKAADDPRARELVSLLDRVEQVHL